MDVTSNLKFGKKQFPTKRSADSAPIFDAVQKSVAPKPCSETRLSYQEHAISPSISEDWEMIDINALPQGRSEAKNNATANASANKLPVKPNGAVSSALTCNGSSRSVKSSSSSAVAVASASASSSACKSPPVVRKSAVRSYHEDGNPPKLSIRKSIAAQPIIFSYINDIISPLTTN